MQTVEANLVAVQARVRVRDYTSRASFQQRVNVLCEQSMSRLPKPHPTLIAFPELFALPLLFELNHYLKTSNTLGAFVCQVLKTRGVSLLKTALTHRAFGIRAAFLNGVFEAMAVYREVFSSAARKFGIYIVGGTLFAPEEEREVSQGIFYPSSRIYNTCYVYNPHGQTIGCVRKQHLTPGLEKLLLHRGPQSDLEPMPTELGRLGVLICYDAFFESLVRRMDNREVSILIQPSANDGWDQPWKHNRRHRTQRTEAEVWMEDGLISAIQGRERIRYAVNPMLVGQYAGIQFRGRSSIGANEALTREPRVISQAIQSEEEELVVATVKTERS